MGAQACRVAREVDAAHDGVDLLGGNREGARLLEGQVVEGEDPGEGTPDPWAPEALANPAQAALHRATPRREALLRDEQRHPCAAGHGRAVGPGG